MPSLRTRPPVGEEGEEVGGADVAAWARWRQGTAGTGQEAAQQRRLFAGHGGATVLPTETLRRYQESGQAIPGTRASSSKIVRPAMQKLVVSDPTAPSVTIPTTRA